MASGNFDPETGRSADVLAVSAFNTITSFDGTQMWDDDGPYHLEAHFTATAARDAYALAMSNAASGLAQQIIVGNYRNSAYGGYWGTIGVAL